MANYSLLVTPTFKPRTFAEMAVPYQMYGEYYNALESSLSTLESALADMEKLKQFEGHEKLYQQYQDFADQLNTYSDKLASGDLKGLRSNIRTAAKDYVKNIKPIEDAYTRAVNQHKMYAELIAQNPSILNAPTKNLQAYYDDPLYTWKPMSGDYLKSTMGSLAQQYKSQHNGSTSSGGYTTHHFGLNSTEVNDLISDDPNAPAKLKYPELVTFINQMKDQYGYNDYDEYKQAMFLDYLKQGLVYGIGQDQVVQNLRNTGYSPAALKEFLDGYFNKGNEEDEDDLISSSVPEVESDTEVPKKIKKINTAETKADQAEVQRAVNKEFNYWSNDKPISKKSQKQFEKRRENYFGKWTQEDVEDVINNWEYIYDNHKTIGDKFRTINGKFISWEDMKAMNMTSKEKWLMVANSMDSSINAAKERADASFARRALTGGGGTLGALENQYKTIEENAMGITLRDLQNTPDAPVQKLREKADKKREKFYSEYPIDLTEEGRQAVAAREAYFSSKNFVTQFYGITKDAEKDRVNTWIAAMSEGNKKHDRGLDVGNGLYKWDRNKEKWEPASPTHLTDPSLYINLRDGLMIKGYVNGNLMEYKVGTNGETSDIDATIKNINKYLLSSGPASYDKEIDVDLLNGATLHVEHDADGNRMFYTKVGNKKTDGYLMDEHGYLYPENGNGGFSNTPTRTLDEWVQKFLDGLLKETLTRILTPEKEE